MKVAKVMCHVVMNSAESVSVSTLRAAQDTSPEQGRLTEVELGAGQNPFVKEDDTGTHGNPKTNRGIQLGP